MRLKEGGNRPRTTDDRPRSTTGNRQRRKTTDHVGQQAIGNRQWAKEIDHGPRTTDHAVQ